MLNFIRGRLGLWIQCGMLLLVIVAGTAITTQGSAFAAPNSVSHETLRDPRHTMLLPQPGFAAHVLHWVQEEYDYVPSGLDPANGQTIRGDIWVQVGTDGAPVVIHGRYTLPNGTLHQEIVQTKSTMTTLYGQDYRGTTVSPSTAPCTIAQSTSTPELLASAIPQFVDGTRLGAKGYTKHSAAPDRPLPTTPALVGTTPSLVYGSPQSVAHWARQEEIAGQINRTQWEDLDANGRLIVSGAVSEIHGTVGTEGWTARGPLQVYAASGIPSSEFSMPSQDTEKCTVEPMAGKPYAPPGVSGTHASTSHTPTSPSQSRTATVQLAYTIPFDSAPPGWFLCVSVPNMRIWDGSTLWGEDCHYFPGDSSCTSTYGYWNCWQIDDDTSESETVYDLYTTMQGLDRCNATQNNTLDIGVVLHHSYYSTYSNPGVGTGHYHTDCSETDDHTYTNNAAHSTMVYSTDGGYSGENSTEYY